MSWTDFILPAISFLLILAAAEGFGEWRASRHLWTPQKTSPAKYEPTPRGTVTAERLAKRIIRNAMVSETSARELFSGPIILPPSPIQNRRPVRVQRRWTHGWQRPAGVVNVAKGTKWANPYGSATVVVAHGADGPIASVMTPEIAVATYRTWALGRVEQIRKELRSRDLMCSCPLNQPCHADVLLELANP